MLDKVRKDIFPKMKVEFYFEFTKPKKIGIYVISLLRVKTLPFSLAFPFLFTVILSQVYYSTNSKILKFRYNINLRGTSGRTESFSEPSKMIIFFNKSKWFNHRICWF